MKILGDDGSKHRVGKRGTKVLPMFSIYLGLCRQLPHTCERPTGVERFWKSLSLLMLVIIVLIIEAYTANISLGVLPCHVSPPISGLS